MDTQETVEITLPVTEVITDPVSMPCRVSEQKSETLAANPIQEEINTEALAIAKRLMKQHSKTWKELEKY